MLQSRGSAKRLLFTCAMTVATLCAVALPSPAMADTIYVSMNGSDTAGTGSDAAPFATVQRGLNVAHAADTVYVNPGYYVGDSLMATTGVSLMGAGPGLTTLRGSGANATLRILGVRTAFVSGLTITGGSATNGGGIYCHNANPIIAANTIVRNTATMGGGIYADTGSLPSISSNLIIDNLSSAGGGIACSGGGTIWGNTIEDNDASDGGGVYCWGGSDTYVTQNTISGNRASAGGGLAWDTVSTPTVSQNTIQGNIALGEGGGVFGASAVGTVTNNVIADNNGASSGGGVCLLQPGAHFGNNTVANNVAATCGAMYCSPASRVETVTNCIFWGNSSALSTSCVTFSCNLPGPVRVGSANVNTDPAFVDPSSGNYHLSADSPCADAASATVSMPTDRDGIVRPWGPGPDIGAYEYYVPRYTTWLWLSAPGPVKLKKTLTVTGSMGPLSTPGSIKIAMFLKAGGAWRPKGRATIVPVAGRFSYSFKPKSKGKWSFQATYGGMTVGPTTYTASSSSTKYVQVK